jgi:phosphohistidine phosphatase SixA/8-oxo-dGTP pyrophosphatase MutT (NUDIX family)
MEHGNPEQAAGGLVWRNGDEGLEILIAHRPRYDDWAFPKGKLDDGESLIECAHREVIEETGLDCRVGSHLGETKFDKPNGTAKTVAYWAMEQVGGSFKANEEVDAVRWVLVPDLSAALTYERDALFVSGLGESWTGPADRILLTRHAHAGDRFRWEEEDDAVRPLSARGKAEAAAIVTQLAVFGIDRILSSHAIRCWETVSPLADRLGREVTASPGLWEEADYQSIVDVLDRSHHGTSVLCSHGPVIASALHAVTGASVGIRMEKASTWVLDFSGPILVAANYLAPPAI